MKNILLAALLTASALVNAQTCTIIVPQKPGGASDVVARILQKHNQNIVVDYKPGAYIIPAMAYADKNTGVGILTTPAMYGKNSPEQSPNVDIVKIFGAYDHGILTNKNVTFNDILTKKINVGISFVGSPAHVIGEQLKSKNPNIELVAFGGDANAFTATKSGDVDVYITAWPSVDKWSAEHNFKVLAKIPSSGNYTQEGVTLTNVSRFGIFMSKNATKEQKTSMLGCINAAFSDPEIKKDFKNIHMNVLNQEDKEAEKTVNLYIETLKQYGI